LKASRVPTQSDGLTLCKYCLSRVNSVKRLITGRSRAGYLLGDVSRSCRYCGEMAEWLKAHAWKACIPQGIQGSNPCLSAITFPPSFWSASTPSNSDLSTCAFARLGLRPTSERQTNVRVSKGLLIPQEPHTWESGERDMRLGISCLHG
jgi:hypothetical protein